MTETFFIGDLHFGHKSICEYEPESRPFACMDDMIGFIIAAWNGVVRPKDRVIVVGDFCFGAANIELAAGLNGVKYLIGGNHDHYATETYLKHFQKVLGVMEFDGKVVTHIPVHPQQVETRYTHNIHGHLHSKLIMRQVFPTRGWIVDQRYINVSCEQNNLTPISYAEIKKKCGEKDDGSSGFPATGEEYHPEAEE